MRRYPLPVLLMAFALTGCEGKTPPDTPAPVWAHSVSPADEAQARVDPLIASPANLANLPKAKRPYHIALLIAANRKADADDLGNGFKSAAREMGAEGRVVSLSGGTEMASAAHAQIETGANALCFVPASLTDVTAVETMAHKNNLPAVAVMDRAWSDAARKAGVEISGVVGADGVTAGRLAGQTLLVLSQDGQVATLSPDGPETARAEGFSVFLNGTISVATSQKTELDADAAAQSVSAILRRYPGLTGLFCTDATLAEGAVRAVAKSGKKGRVAVITCGSVSQLHALLTSGDLMAVIEQHLDRQGGDAARMVVGLLDGRIRAGEETYIPLESSAPSRLRPR